MRAVTRNFLLGILAVLVLLLALGALPSLIKAGDPYYMGATPTNETHPAVQAGNLSERTYPYATAALANASADETGYSDPYWKGYVGLKEAFTHSPFDEMESFRQRNPAATEGDAVFLRNDGTLYRVAVTQR